MVKAPNPQYRHSPYSSQGEPFNLERLCITQLQILPWLPTAPNGLAPAQLASFHSLPGSFHSRHADLLPANHSSEPLLLLVLHLTRSSPQNLERLSHLSSFGFKVTCSDHQPIITTFTRRFLSQHPSLLLHSTWQFGKVTLYNNFKFSVWLPQQNASVSDHVRLPLCNDSEHTEGTQKTCGMGEWMYGCIDE